MDNNKVFQSNDWIVAGRRRSEFTCGSLIKTKVAEFENCFRSAQLLQMKTYGRLFRCTYVIVIRAITHKNTLVIAKEYSHPVLPMELCRDDPNKKNIRTGKNAV